MYRAGHGGDLRALRDPGGQLGDRLPAARRSDRGADEAPARSPISFAKPYASPEVIVRRVVRRDRRDRPRHMLHDACEVDSRLAWVEADSVGVAHAVRQGRRCDQALAGHATGPQAVAARSLTFDQGDPRARSGGDRRRHEPGGAAAEHDEVVAAAAGGHGDAAPVAAVMVLMGSSPSLACRSVTTRAGLTIRHRSGRPQSAVVAS